MLEKAIDLIEKQKEMYEIQEKNITKNIKKRKLIQEIKEDIRKEKELRNYILEILNKQKK